MSEINKGLNTSHRFLEGSCAWKEATTAQTASPACGYPPGCRLNAVQPHQLRLTQEKPQTAPVSNVTAVLITYKQEETGLKEGGADQDKDR